MSIFILSLIAVIIHQVAWFLWSWFWRDNGWADVGWGTGFILVGALAYVQHPQMLSLLLMIGTALWGMRLSVYLIIRKKQQKGEDWRYKNWREEWGSTVVLRSLLQVFLLQGLFMWVVSLPLQLVAHFNLTYTLPLLLVGGIIFLFGWCYESIADLQLFRFKQDPANKGKILHGGLWKYSRHPNYFGEIVLWWGLFVATLGSAPAWLGILSPICISWLILRVSGVPMLERKQQQQVEFQKHMTHKPALVPNFFQTKAK
jgi:steroid 5-alpha reductase family enzyme